MPSTDYFYGLEVGGDLVESAQGTFTTAPPPSTPATLRFAFGSCVNQAHEQPIFEAIRDEIVPALFLFLGDNHYSATTERAWQRAHYRESRKNESLSYLLKHTPTLATWDDHDYSERDNGNGTHPERYRSRWVFREYWANPSYGEQGAGVYFRYDYGDIAFFVLDGRFFRASTSVEELRERTDPAGNPSILGRRQTEWLLNELDERPGAVNLIAVGSQWSTELAHRDSWSGYPAARDWLLERLKPYRVVLLSGDAHYSEIRCIDRRSEGCALPDLTSSPLANTPQRCGSASRERELCVDGGNSVVVVEVDTEANSLTAVIYSWKKGSLESQHSWTIPLATLGTRSTP